MSNNKKHKHRPERRVYVRGVRHEQPDLRRLARVLIEFARAEAEAQAAAEHDSQHKPADDAGSEPSSPEHGEAA